MWHHRQILEKCMKTFIYNKVIGSTACSIFTKNKYHNRHFSKILHTIFWIFGSKARIVEPLPVPAWKAIFSHSFLSIMTNILMHECFHASYLNSKSIITFSVVFLPNGNQGLLISSSKNQFTFSNAIIILDVKSFFPMDSCELTSLHSLRVVFQSVDKRDFWPNQIKVYFTVLNNNMTQPEVW